MSTNSPRSIRYYLTDEQFVGRLNQFRRACKGELQYRGSNALSRQLIATELMIMLYEGEIEMPYDNSLRCDCLLCHMLRDSNREFNSCIDCIWQYHVDELEYNGDSIPNRYDTPCLAYQRNQELSFKIMMLIGQWLHNDDDLAEYKDHMHERNKRLDLLYSARELILTKLNGGNNGN